jgi:hypothetical protein
LEKAYAAKDDGGALWCEYGTITMRRDETVETFLARKSALEKQLGNRGRTISDEMKVAFFEKALRFSTPTLQMQHSITACPVTRATTWTASPSTIT